MATYATAYLNSDPEEFVKQLDPYSEPAADDDDSNEDDVEEGLEELEDAPAHGSPEWKQLIASMAKPTSLPLGGGYKRESQDPKHRMGDLLEHCFKVYEQKNPGDKDGIHFYQWLDGMSDLDRVMMIANNPLVRNVAKQENIKPSMVKAFMRGVAYLDKAGRKNHKVVFKGGTAMASKGGAEVPLDTSEMSTVFSGKGFGIWVMSEKGKLYVGNHIKGMVHHSSFLSGANVMCGGEMRARMGKIDLLSAKSGHYQPGTEHLIWALNVLETCVSNFDDIKVMAWVKNQTPLNLISPRTLMFNTYKYDTWGKISPDEMTRLRAGSFASFPG